jgi:UDP-glucose 4-epimerase
MKILVTGAAGFVGARVATQLLEAGHDVTVFDNLSVGRRLNVPEGARFVEGDLCRIDDIRTAVKGHDAVAHLAAQAQIPESVKNPQKSFDINLVGGQNLLEAMRHEHVNRMVYSSTAGVYGNPVHVPVAESDPMFPISPYGATKLAFEALLHTYHAAYGFNVSLFRYFNPYGPTENHDPETHAIPNFIKAALAGKLIPLYWNGEQIRDFFYVDDIARAHVMGLAQDGFHVYNLGSGSGQKVRDVVEKILQLTDSKSAIEDLGERPGDPPQLTADTSKVRRELGWQPKTTLEEGLKLTIEGFRRRLP